MPARSKTAVANLGLWRSWERVSMALRRSGVRVPSGPPIVLHTGSDTERYQYGWYHGVALRPDVWDEGLLFWKKRYSGYSFLSFFIVGFIRCCSLRRRSMITRAKYKPAEIEKKWQEQWETEHAYYAPDDSPRPNYYNLVMLPYPSGDLHIGHWHN